MRIAGFIISFLLIVFIGLPVAVIAAAFSSAGFGVLVFWYATLGLWLLAAMANAARTACIIVTLLYLMPVLYVVLNFAVLIPIRNKEQRADFEELAAKYNQFATIARPIQPGESVLVREITTNCDTFCVELLVEAGFASVIMEKSVFSNYYTDDDSVGAARAYRIERLSSCAYSPGGRIRYRKPSIAKQFELAGFCVAEYRLEDAPKPEWIFSIGPAVPDRPYRRLSLSGTLVEHLEDGKYRRLAYNEWGVLGRGSEKLTYGTRLSSDRLVGRAIGVPIDQQVSLLRLFGAEEQAAKSAYLRALAESGDIDFWRAFLYEVAALPELSAEVFELIWENYSRYSDSALLYLSNLMANRTEDFKPALPIVMEIMVKEEPGWGHLYGELKWYDFADLALFESQLREIEDRKIARYQLGKEHPATSLCRKGNLAEDGGRKDLLETIESMRGGGGLPAQWLAVARLESPSKALEIADRVDSKNKLWMVRRCLEKLEEHYGDREIPARFCHLEGCSRVWDLGNAPASLSR